MNNKKIILITLLGSFGLFFAGCGPLDQNDESVANKEANIDNDMAMEAPMIHGKSKEIIVEEIIPEKIIVEEKIIPEKVIEVVKTEEMVPGTLSTLPTKNAGLITEVETLPTARTDALRENIVQEEVDHYKEINRIMPTQHNLHTNTTYNVNHKYFKKIINRPVDIYTNTASANTVVTKEVMPTVEVTEPNVTVQPAVVTETVVNPYYGYYGYYNGYYPIYTGAPNPNLYYYSYYPHAGM